MLNAFLDFYRATVLNKLVGVNKTDLLRAPISPSTMSLLGMLKHLADTECWWFQVAFANLEVSRTWSETDPDADWRVEANETLASIVEVYQTEVAKSRQIISNLLAEVGETQTLETKAKRSDYQERSLRWIMFHMLEEYARHAGHADLMREVIDGVTGV
jgi:hypothetical protein